jgi:prepilin-type N-terminal cleavage/methylation domain-containing protein/prepilin-type processing-associated H-X9-DG protein
MRTRKSGFTLVELLVVIGIIALLIGILMPALNRAREQGRRAQCLSNIRQISMAFFMYTNENKGWFPAPGVFGGGLGQNTVNDMSPTWFGRAEDWIVWRNKQPDDPLEGSIVKYMNNPDPSVLRCPSDPGLESRWQVPAAGDTYYPYSYSMNSYLSFGAWYHPTLPPPLGTPAQESGDPGYNNFLWKANYAWKITQVKNSSQKVIVYEVDERVIRDGRAQMQSPNVGMNINNKIMMVAIRHDGSRSMPDDFPDPTTRQTIDKNANVDKRGNCGFVDGHAEYVTRRDAHSRPYYDPKFTDGDPTK